MNEYNVTNIQRHNKKQVLCLVPSDDAFMLLLLFLGMKRGLCDMCENFQLRCEDSQLKLDFHGERTSPSDHWSDSSQYRTNSIWTDFLYSTMRWSEVKYDEVLGTWLCCIVRKCLKH